MQNNGRLIEEFQDALVNGILKRWYPLVVDKECGGYYSNVANDWTLPREQEKMIVTQARHIWTLAKVSDIFGGKKEYADMAMHGFPFLKSKMWDEQYGGFYQIRNREGGWSDVNHWRDEKRAYGNAFAVYGLAALYEVTHDPAVLEFAQQAFFWIEDHAFDPLHKGYFQFIARDGKPFDSTSTYISLASDKNELGYKDQNSSIHLLEAYTGLYHVWNNPAVADKLKGLLELIRDVEVSEQGYLRLFFTPDWKPVSFRHAPEAERKANYGLDHVSFGHDYETAFLMLEASHALGIPNDYKTLATAKRMLDHAIQNGWDEQAGGFYDGGYYFAGTEKCSIIKETKNWWSQAEGLNALLLFSKIFPGEQLYQEYFHRQWKYIRSNILDLSGGDWYEGGIDKEPHSRKGPKSHIWKCTYHTCRSLMNCIALLQNDTKAQVTNVVDHWRSVAAALK